jgi:hypothetical protein
MYDGIAYSKVRSLAFSFLFRISFHILLYFVSFLFYVRVGVGFQISQVTQHLTSFRKHTDIIETSMEEYVYVRMPILARPEKKNPNAS